MNREDIIRMAREAGLDIDSWEPLYEGGLTGFGVYECTHEELERFAALVASAERERIAKKIEQLPFGDTSASFAIYVREDAEKN